MTERSFRCDTTGPRLCGRPSLETGSLSRREKESHACRVECDRIGVSADMFSLCAPRPGAHRASL